MERKDTLKDEARGIVAVAKREIRSLNDGEKERINAIKTEIETINGELRSIAEVAEIQTETENLKENHRSMSEKTFSLTKAIRAAANNVAFDETTQAVINAGKEQMRARSLDITGQIQLPDVANMEQRAVTYAGEHDDVVVTNVYSPLDYLRAKNVIVAAGAKLVTGAKGDIQIPVLGSDITCTWESETAETSASTPAFSSVKFTPKRLSTRVEVSRMLIEQDSLGIEEFLMNAISEAINSKLEATIFDASAGTTTRPQGLMYDSSTIADASTFAQITTMEANAEENGYFGECKWIVSPKAKAALRTKTKGNGVTVPVYDNGEIDGTKVLSTGHLKGNNAVYGDFSNYGIVCWNNVQITVDPLTAAAKGAIVLTVNFYVDAKPIRSNAFTHCTIH